MSNQSSNAKAGRIFGSKNLPVGVNIANAVRGWNEQIGIPDSRLHEVDAIFKKALTPQEYEVARLGFGLLCELKLQNAIAIEIGVEANRVSAIASNVRDKLQKAPYRGKLLRMVPSLEDVMKAHASYTDQKTVLNSQCAQIRGLRTQIDHLKAEKAALEAENDALKDERAALAKRLEDAKESAKRARSVSSEVLERMEKASAMATSKFEENFDKLVGETKSLAIKAMKESFRDTFDEVLGDSAEYLRGFGINSLGILTRMSRRNLTGIKVPEEKIVEIETRLALFGLSLRAG